MYWQARDNPNARNMVKGRLSSGGRQTVNSRQGSSGGDRGPPSRWEAGEHGGGWDDLEGVKRKLGGIETIELDLDVVNQPVSQLIADPTPHPLARSAANRIVIAECRSSSGYALDWLHRPRGGYANCPTVGRKPSRFVYVAVIGIVSGRLKPASEGRFKTSHYES